MWLVDKKRINKNHVVIRFLSPTFVVCCIVLIIPKTSSRSPSNNYFALHGFFLINISPRTTSVYWLSMKKIVIVS
jgi:hypothetical protein